MTDKTNSSESAEAEAEAKPQGQGRPGHGGPARGTGTRPPFTVGNAMQTTHGGRSRRVYEPLAEQLAVGLIEDRPDLERYPEAVAAWAQAEAQSLLFRRRLAEVSPLDEDGEPRVGLLKWSHQVESSAAKHRARLGLDPRAEAALARERAEASVLSVDLEAIAAAGRKALDARDAAGLPPPRDTAGDVLESVITAGAQAQAKSNEQYEREVNKR